jgi:hypothetical protein
MNVTYFDLSLLGFDLISIILKIIYLKIITEVSCVIYLTEVTQEILLALVRMKTQLMACLTV